MKPKKVKVETIHQFIRGVKNRDYPLDMCILTYCKLGGRLYFRLDGPVADGQYLSYYYSTRSRKRFNLSPKRYVKVVKDYLVKHGLNVLEKKLPYHEKIEHEKKMSKPEADSHMRIFNEMFGDDNNNNHRV